MNAQIIPIRPAQEILDKIPPFPEVVDSTIRAAFADCNRKGYWQFIRQRRKREGNIDLVFGGCFAKGMECARKAYYNDGLSERNSITEGLIAATAMWEDHEADTLVPYKGSKANKTYSALVDAFDSYFVRWPLDDAEIMPLRLPNGELFIEKTFAFPLDGTSHPITGKPIVYAGRLDMLGEWKDAGLYIGIDEKTSTQLGDAWAARWLLRGQITGYCRGSSLYGFKIRHFHIRGIGILSKDITFAENLQNRHDWQIETWEKQVTKDINRATDTWRKMYHDQEVNGFNGKHLEEHWDQNLDTMCSSYGGCDFQDLCSSQNPERWLNNYDIAEWNPLANRD